MNVTRVVCTRVIGGMDNKQEGEAHNHYSWLCYNEALYHRQDYMNENSAEIKTPKEHEWEEAKDALTHRRQSLPKSPTFLGCSSVTLFVRVLQQSVGEKRDYCNNPSKILVTPWRCYKATVRQKRDYSRNNPSMMSQYKEKSLPLFVIVYVWT